MRTVFSIANLFASGIGKVVLKLEMIGLWQKPFGLGFLALKDVSADVSYLPGSPTADIEYSGEAHIGKIGNGKEIKVRISFGYDSVNIVNSYFYGSINKLSLAALAEAFGFDMVLSQFVSDAGLEQLEVGFSPTGKHE